jgi:RNA polymerase sigma-70 factor (ECF subfamily)
MSTTLSLASLAAAEPAEDRDAPLVRAAQADPQAFSALYRRHYATIVGYLHRRVGDAHLAEDLAADTFIAALGSIDRYRPTGAPFRAWLLRIATNLANNHLRRAARRRRRLSYVERWREEHGPDPEAHELARAALLRLSPDHQAVLCLHHVEGLGVEAVAEVLGCRVGTVKSRLARAREAFRTQLQRRSTSHG